MSYGYSVAELAHKWGRWYDVSASLLIEVMRIESGFRADAVGDGGQSFGLMQLHKHGALADWEQRHGKVLDPFNPDVNVRIGAWYLGERIPQLLKSFGVEDNVTSRIIAYNAGITAARDGRVPAVTAAYLQKLQAAGINLSGSARYESPVPLVFEYESESGSSVGAAVAMTVVIMLVLGLLRFIGD